MDGISKCGWCLAEAKDADDGPATDPKCKLSFFSFTPCLFFKRLKHGSCCVCFFVYLFSLTLVGLGRGYWCINIVVSVM